MLCHCSSSLIGEGAFKISLMARFILTVLVIVAIGTVTVRASDPELTMDFFVPPGVNISSIDGSFFTFRGLEGGVSPPPAPGQLGAGKVFNDAFPALNGLGISAALLEFTPWSVNPVHTHPRATELLYMISGTLRIGFVDTTNKRYDGTITAGDFFVFPKGLVHYQINEDDKVTAVALAAFSSSNPGVVSIPPTVFASELPIDVLTESFGVSSDVISLLEAGAA